MAQVKTGRDNQDVPIIRILFDVDKSAFAVENLNIPKKRVLVHSHCPNARVPLDQSSEEKDAFSILSHWEAPEPCR